MAKIRYYKDPLKNDFKDFITKKETLKEVLKSLKIEDRPLNVKINGKTPDDLPLDTRLKENDSIEIRRIVLGSGGGSGNKVLATVVQIAATIAAVATGVPAIAKAGILIAGSLISGAIRQAGFRRSTPETEQPEQKPAANAFSITSASNQSRQLQPMKVIMGSHRVAPDYASQPTSDYYPQAGIPIEVSEPVKNLRNLSVDVSNPLAWPTIPAGWIRDNIFSRSWYYFGPNTTSNHPSSPKNYTIWPYELSVHPDSFANLSNYTSETDDFWIRETTFASNRYIGSWPFQFGLSNGSTGQSFQGKLGQIPVIIYHSDSLDPFQGTYSTLDFIIWSVLAYYNDTTTRSSTYYRPFYLNRAAFVSPSPPSYINSNIKDIYGFLIGDNNTIANTFGGNTSISNAVSTTGQDVYSRLFEEQETVYLPAADDDSNSCIFDFFRGKIIRESTPSQLFWPPGSLSFQNGPTFFTPDSLNGELRKQDIWNYIQAIQTNFLNKAWLFEELELEKEPYSQRVRHIFSYGLGDLEIQDRRIKDTPITDYQESTFETGVMSSNGNLLSGFYGGSAATIEQGADLINNNSNFSGPDTGVPFNDFNDYNWIKRQTPDNCKEFTISISGRSFTTNDDGTYSPFIAEFEVQYKLSTSTNYTFLDTFQLSSYRSNTVRRTKFYSLPVVGKYDIRVRKITKDPTETSNFQEFTLEDFTFFRDDGSDYIAQNREGLTLVATNRTGSQVQEYNALVESKCWVYKQIPSNPGQFAWFWEHTRNPAWWFLYFARGAFVNRSNAGVSPVLDINNTISPTFGWVNDAEQPNNEERMFGAGFKLSEIDIDKIIEWAEFCETNNLFLDLILEGDEPSSESLEKIANIGRASVSFYQGILSVVYEDPSQQKVGMYGMSNIIAGSFSIDYITNEVPQLIRGFYTDRNEDWKTKTVEAFVPGQTDVEKVVEVTLEGVTETQQAQREINILAARQLYQRRKYAWKAGSDGLLVQRGVLVYLSHDLTQYDFSGRISEFYFNEDKTQVTGVRLPICVDSDTTNIMIRLPNNRMVNFDVTTAPNNVLNFTGFYSIFNAPENYNNKGDTNTESDFFDSVPEDFLFFCGAQSSLGKIVRIESVQEDSDGTYDILAIEEEPALYAYEYDQTEIPALENSRIKAVVESADYKDLGGGLVEICFEVQGAYAVEIRNDETGLPIQSSSGATIFGQKARFELIPNSTYNLTIIPILIGSPYERITKKIKVVTSG